MLKKSWVVSEKEKTFSQWGLLAPLCTYWYFHFSKHGQRTKVSDAFWFLAPFHLGTMETCMGRQTQHVGLLICRQKHCHHDAKQVKFQFPHHYQERGEDSEQQCFLFS